MKMTSLKHIVYNIIMYNIIVQYITHHIKGFVGLCGSSSRLPLSVDNDHGLVTLASYALERPQLDVSLHDGVRKLAANQALCIKDLGMVCTQLSEPKHERFRLGNR